MPQASVTTKQNETHMTMMGILWWLAWNRIKFLVQSIAASLYRASGKRLSRHGWERLEERRRDRESFRSYLKHYKHCNCIQLAILLMLWISERQVQNFWDCLRQQILRRSRSQTLKPTPVLLRGLSGFARTDSTVPAVSF